MGTRRRIGTAWRKHKRSRPFSLCAVHQASDASPGSGAFQCGLHGVLSSQLAVDDAAHALVQICRGERQFRFDPPETRFVSPRRVEPAHDTAAAPPPDPADFDALWMFECRPGV